MSQSEVIDTLVDMDLACLTNEEIEGGYRSLCAAMLLRAAQEMGVQRQYSKPAIEARRITRAWLFKDLGLITLDEACYACNIDRQWYVNNVVDAAEEEAAQRLRPAPRCVFGRMVERPALA